ncbi:LPXTG cell wall anchor domain-containing protein [Lactobacillus mulieris]|nr:LPXTG cell wall anchor domain-containing protein [Lactobacillus mulieris]
MHQTVGQQTSTLQLQSTGTMTVAPGGQIGYLYTTLGNSSVTKLGTVYEPTIYYVMPKGISAQKLSGLYVQNFQGVVPKISEFKNSDGSYTVKVDYKGTGFTYDFANQEKDDEGQPKLLGFWIQALPDAAKGSYDIKAYIDTTTPMDKTTNPASSDDVKKLLGLTNDNQLYDLGSFTAKVGLGDSETGVTLSAGPDGIWRQRVQATNKKGENLQFAYSVINTSSKELSNNHIILSLPSGQGGYVGSQHPDKYGRTMTFRLTGPIQLPDDLKNAEVKYSTQDFNFNGNMSDISDLSSFVSAAQVTDWNIIKTIEIYLPTIAANSQSGRIILNGQDTTAEGDFNGIGFLANGLYSDSMAPQIVTQINSKANPNEQIAATIRINRLVKVPVKLVKADGTKIEIPSMEKEYNPNDSSLIISQDYPQANIPADLITANVQPGYSINGPVFTNGSGSNLSWGVTVSTTGGQEIDFYVESKKITVSGKTPDGPKTPDTPLPDNPNMNYPEHVDKQALYKEVTRTINVYNKDKQLVGSKTETLKLYRTATVNEATGKVEEYSKWQMVTPTTSGWDKYLFGQVQSGDLIKVEVTDEDGRKLTTDPVSGETIPATEMSADNIQSPIIKQTDSEGNSVYGVKEVSVDDLINTINQKQTAGDTADITVNEIVNVSVGPAQVTLHVYWVDTQTPDTSSDSKDGFKLVQKQDVTDYPGTKATLDKLPENYDYADGQDQVTEITNNGQDVVIRLKHKISTNTETKTITRTINITKPGEETKTTKQSVTFSKTDSTDLVTNQPTEGKWTRTSDSDQFTGLTEDDLKVDHYTTKISKNGQADDSATAIPTETVTAGSSDETFDVTYAPIKKSETVYWVDTETKDSAGQEGYKVVASELVSEQLEGSIYQLTKSTPENYVLADGQADIKSVTVDGNNVIIKLKHRTNKVPETRTVTRVVYVTKPNATKASRVVNTAIEFTRDNVVDAVNGQIEHGDWDPDSAVINGYTPTPQDHYKVVIHKGTPDGETVQSIDQINNATGDTPSDIYYVTYNPINKSETVYWLDTETQDPAGQKGLKVVQSEDTPSQIEDSSYTLTKKTPTNYVLADDQVDIKSVTVDGNNVYIMLKHGTTQGTKETKTLTRIVYVTKPGENEPTKKYDKTITFTRTPTVDAVDHTKVIDSGTWTLESGSWDAFTPDKVDHYTPVIHKDSADGQEVNSIIAKTNVNADTPNETYYVTYNPIESSETIYWVDTQTPDTSDKGYGGYKVIQSENAGGQEGSTYTIKSKTPEDGYIPVGEVPTTVVLDGNDVIIKMKHGTKDGEKETKTVKRTVYAINPGETEPTKVFEKSVEFSRTPTLDAVNGDKLSDGTWTPEKGTLAGYTPDDQPNYTAVIHKDTATGQVVESIPENDDITINSANEVYYVTYTVNAHSLTVTVHDNDIDTDLDDYGFKGEGDPNTDTGYDWNKVKQILQNKGYKIVDDQTIPTTYGTSDATYTIHVEHEVVPVGPDNPEKPGTPINPNDPEGPKWPSEDQYKKAYTFTLHFLDKDGKVLHASITKSVDWTRTVYVDKTNGQIVKDPRTTDWKASSENYDAIDIPQIDGYVANSTTKKGLKVENDKVTAAANEQANSEDDLVYTVVQHSLTVTVHDNDTDTDLTYYGFSGKGDPNTDTGYDWNKVKKNLQNKGYKIVNDQTIPTTYGTSDATYTINVQHGTKAGDTETKTVTRTVNITKPGEKTVSTTEKVTFNKTDSIDLVTGKTVKEGTWTSDKKGFDATNVELLDGFKLKITETVDGQTHDVTSIPAEEVTENSQDEIFDIIYLPTGKSLEPLVSREVTRTVTITKPGEKPSTKTQTVTFSGSQNPDGTITWDNDPKVENKFNAISVDSVDGYKAVIKNSDGKVVQSIDDENLNPATAKDEHFTVTYEKIATPAPEPSPAPTPEPTPTSNPKPAANTHPENVKPEIHPSLTKTNVVKGNFKSAKSAARRINKLNSATKAEKLPQTGESKTNASLLGLLGLGMSMALGLVSRKKKEDK